MKLVSSLKPLVFLALCLSQIVSLQAEQVPDQKCDDACKVCQRVVYQIKFHGVADCEVNGVCKNTCYKIKEVWNTPWNPFDPFTKDMFGKCEICFRAGHCTISQCKDQERNEIEIINHVINSSSLTARINGDLLVGFPDQVDPRAVESVKKLNSNVEKTLNRGIKDSLVTKSTEELIPQVQNLVNNYVKAPISRINSNADAILNKSSVTPSGVDVNFWDDGSDKVGKAQKFGNSAQNILHKLDRQIEDIKGLKSGAKKHDKKEIVKVALKTKKDIKKVDKKLKNVENKLVKKEKQIEKLLKKEKDEDVKTSLKTALGKVIEYKQAVSKVKADVKKRK